MIKHKWTRQHWIKQLIWPPCCVRVVMCCDLWHYPASHACAELRSGLFNTCAGNNAIFQPSCQGLWTRKRSWPWLVKIQCRPCCWDLLRFTLLIIGTDHDVYWVLNMNPFRTGNVPLSERYITTLTMKIMLTYTKLVCTLLWQFTSDHSLFASDIALLPALTMIFRRFSDWVV